MYLTFRADGTIWACTSEPCKVQVIDAKIFWQNFCLLDRKNLFELIRRLAATLAVTNIPATTWNGNEGYGVPLLPDMPIWGAGKPIAGIGHNFFSKGIGRIAIAHGGKALLRDSTTPHIFEAEQVALVNRFGEIVGFCAGNDISAGKDFDPHSKARRGMFVCGHTIQLLDSDDNLPGDTIISLKITGTPGCSGQKTVAKYARDPRVLVPELFGILGKTDGPSTGFALSLGAAAKNDPAVDHTPMPGDNVEISITEFPALRHGVALATE